MRSHSPLSKGGGEGIKDSVCHLDRPDPDLAPVFERHGQPDGLPVDVRSVFAPQILDRCLPARNDDSGMVTRDGGGINADRTVAIAAHQVQTFGEKPLAAPRDKAGA